MKPKGIDPRQRAWDAYNGIYKKPLRVRGEKVDPNITPNYAKAIVDKTVAMLFGDDVIFDVQQDELAGETGVLAAAQHYLDATWEASNKLALLQKAAINGSVTGHVSLQLVPGSGYPRIVNLDPSIITVETDPHDCETVTAYKLQWTLDDHTFVTSYMRQEWVLDPNGTWVFYAGLSDSPVYVHMTQVGLWPYTFPPILTWQNLPVPNTYHGAPDLSEDVLALIARLHLNLSNWNKTVIHHAHPKSIGSGFDADELKMAADQTTVLPSKDARLWLLEMEGKGEPSEKLQRHLEHALHTLTRIPDLSTDKMSNVGVLSGLALHILYEPLIHLTKQKRAVAGPALAELSRRILTLGGFEGLTVSVEWPELLPADPEVEGRILTADKKMGLASTETLQKKRGYNPRKEAARIARETANES